MYYEQNKKIMEILTLRQHEKNHGKFDQNMIWGKSE